MHHRGPDDAGVWVSADACVGLAHQRLSIIDLSAAASQPMHGEGGLAIVFNGEIYNYRELRDELRRGGACFRTESDTEVLLHAFRRWGSGCFFRLRGMFSCALYDPRTRRLTLARDRAGEKPLFVRHAAGRLCFASELKALLADPAAPRTLSPAALDHYLAYGYVPGALCLVDGVMKLPPAHWLEYDVAADTARVERYWDLPAPPGPARHAADPEELCTELETLLQDAVRSQLVADVPVAVLLSGGLDSSIVTAVAAQVSSGPLRTFNVSFPDSPAHDEAPFARLVADAFGTRHTTLVAEPQVAEVLPDIARQVDEPLGDSSLIPTYLVSREVRPHATVALGGDGGDELFGGYPHYSWLQRLDRAQRRIPGPVRALAAATGALLPVGAVGRNYLMASGSPARTSITQVNLFFDPRSRRRLAPLIAAGAGAVPSPEAYRLGLAADGRGIADAAMRADFRGYLPDDLLVKVDRASMLCSLEVRAPFLDPAIVEFAFGRLPPQLRATATERKILLRRLGARLLPAELDLRRKQGFSIPIGKWMSSELGELVKDTLLHAPASLLDQSGVRALLRSQRWGMKNGNRLFALLMLELWRREYRIEVPDAPVARAYAS